LKVGEAVLVAAVSAIIFMILVYAVPDCQPVRGADAAAAHDVNATGHLPPLWNSTVADDVVAADDVTRDPGAGITEADEHDPEQHYEDHGGHGDVFQVGNAVSCGVSVNVGLQGPRPCFLSLSFFFFFGDTFLTRTVSSSIQFVRYELNFSFVQERGQVFYSGDYGGEA